MSPTKIAKIASFFLFVITNKDFPARTMIPIKTIMIPKIEVNPTFSPITKIPIMGTNATAVPLAIGYTIDSSPFSYAFPNA